MSMSVKELRQFRDNLERLKGRAPEVMEEILIGEGVYAVGQARKIVTNAGVVNTGAYRYNFHTGTKAQPAHTSARIHDGSKPRRQGRTWVIDVYNNLDYASFLEMGFRSHFVPGHWEGNTFVYQRNDPEGGMYVGPWGGYVQGTWALRTAMRRTEMTQKARIQRKFDRIIRDELEKGL